MNQAIFTTNQNFSPQLPNLGQVLLLILFMLSIWSKSYSQSNNCNTAVYNQSISALSYICSEGVAHLIAEAEAGPIDNEAAGTVLGNNSVEICDNRIDDDGDGLIDCMDPDCSGNETCWDCITEFYQVHSNDYLVALDPTTGTYTNLGNITGADQINGAQFNQIDGHVYAPIMKDGVHQLGMLLETGEVRETGLQLPGSSIFYVGSIDSDGTMYVSNAGGIYSIELNAPILEALSTGVSNPGVADFALDLTRELFYGITGQAKLQVFDPSTLEVNTYNLAGSINNDSGGYGAAWSSNDGSFFAYNNSSGKIYAIDVETLTATQVLNGTGNLSINDGFNCVLAPPPFESKCNNGIDDDGDGLIDCEDGDCFTSNECTLEICDNGIDDDGDGWIDCSDTECFNLTFCVEICDNGIDDNGDGLVDSADPQCNTPAGVTGGLESNGSLADRISKRNIKLILENDEEVQMKKEGIIPFTQRINRGAFDLSNFIPQEFSDAFISESSPEDLIGITNAEDVIAADYYLGDQRVASILAIASDEVYEHTKYICDRLGGSRLIDVSQLFHNGGLFLSYELLNPQSKVEYALSFSMYHDDTEGFVIENHWNLHTYPSDKEYYNFQIWASDYTQLIELLTATTDRIKEADKIGQINNSMLPGVFVTHGQYKNGNLKLQIRNKIGARKLHFDAMVRRTETSDWEPLELDLSLYGNASEIISVPVGYLYDFGSSLNSESAISDEIFLADGRWTIDTEHTGATVSAYTITAQQELAEDNTHQVERGIELEAEITDYLNIYRALDPKYQAVDLSEYNAFSFKSSGTGLIDVTLVKESIVEWKDQPRVRLRIEGAQAHQLSYDQFATNAAVSWDDLVMIVFTVMNENGSSQSYELELSDLAFVQQSSTSSEDLEPVVVTAAISPNPVTAKATVSFESPEFGEAQIMIYDNLGRLVENKSVSTVSGNNVITMDLSRCDSGRYLFRVVAGNGTTLLVDNFVKI